MEMHGVSIIIPLYNRKHLLQRCVASVRNQSYADWELIIVNDGSTDQPENMLEELQREEPRIRVVHQPNGGVSSARNAGLEIAQRKYVQFLDSDDELLPGILAASVAEAEESQADAVTFRYCYEKAGAYREQKGMHEVFRTNDICRYVHKVMSCAGINSPINKLWRRACIAEMRFPLSVSWGEDLIFNLKCISRCHRVSLLPQYGYCVHSGSPISLSSRYSPHGFADLKAQREAIADFLCHFPDEALKDEFSCYLWSSYMQCIRKLCMGSGLAYHEIVSRLQIWNAEAFVRELLPYAAQAPTLVSLLMSKNLFFPVPVVQRMVACKSYLAVTLHLSGSGTK